MKQIKILYAEDELFLGKIVKESLESRSFNVNMIADGEEVITAFRDFQPDISILDVMLPNRDGFSIGKEIKTIAPTQPIIYLTAKNQTKDLLEGFQSGGNDYIKKPFSMEELIARIQNLLNLTDIKIEKQTVQTAIRLGEFIFYPLKYQLVYQEQIQKLSHRETELLKIFTKNQNKTIDRKDILLKIWGDDSYFNSRNLDVYIKKIRNYLKIDPALKIITLKGIGYHFVIDP